MARRHTGQIWPGDNSTKNTKSWPPSMGSSSIVGALIEIIAEAESKSDYLRYVCCLEKLGHLCFKNLIGFRFGS